MNQNKKKIFLDDIPRRSSLPKPSGFSSPDFLSREIRSTVFSRNRCDSGVSVSEQTFFSAKVIGIKNEKKKLEYQKFLDMSCRVPGQKKIRNENFFQKRALFPRRILRVREKISNIGALVSLSPAWAMRASLLTAIFIGAISTTVAYRYFGDHVFARGNLSNIAVVSSENSSEQVALIPEEKTVLGEEASLNDDRFVEEVVNGFEDMQATKKELLEAKIREMVKGYPIEDMIPYIMEKDRIVASFLIGIAKKESAWGKRVPVYQEHDCFNYWGYRGQRRLMGTGGHTCFNSKKDAVDTVSRRLEKLINAERVDTPAEMMVVWKCGYDCSAHSKADTKKWIQDVDLYFHQLDEEE